MAKKQTSAEKRYRQSEDRRIRNKSVKTATRTAAKKFTVLALKKDSEQAAPALRDLVKRLDTAARKGIITKNAAARKKSRMQRLYNSIQSAQ